MKPGTPAPVKLFVGLLYSDPSFMERAMPRLTEAFGDMDYKSPEFPFEVSDYYRYELGWPILRRFVSFRELIDPGNLPEMKHTTNLIENDLAVGGRRRVNLDPGYMDYNKVVLASAKYNAQKIYLHRGIYADPTLWYEGGTFEPYPYSFPDFKTGAYTPTFVHMRALYKGQRRKQEQSHTREA